VFYVYTKVALNLLCVSMAENWNCLLAVSESPISNFKTEKLSSGLDADIRSQKDMTTDKFIHL
jgi:hypothetical protein